MITTSKELALWVTRYLSGDDHDVLAVDTEFMCERTYYPKLGLVQLCARQGGPTLVDTVAIDDLSPLGRLLKDERVEKVLHDPQQDLTILRRATGAYPRNVFDTRAAAGFIGLSAVISMSNLLEELLQVRLAKTSTRTNWLQRPLSADQIQYAADDVRYLVPLRDALVEQATSLNRSEWLLEEQRAYDDDALYAEKDPMEQYKRVKRTGRLSERTRPVLRELAALREEAARRRDIPRGWLLSDEAIVAVTHQQPRTLKQLEQINGFERRLGKQLKQDVLRAIERGLASSLVPERRHRAEKSGTAPSADDAFALVKHRCSAHRIDLALVASRHEVRAVVHDGPHAEASRHRLLRGWRRHVVGQDLLDWLAGRLDWSGA